VPELEAVTFDFWNTLFVEPPGHLRGRRLDAWGGILEEAGFAVEREWLDAVFEASWDRYVSHWKAGQQYQAVQAAEEIVASLGFEMPPAVQAELVSAFTAAGHEATIEPTEGVGDCLAALRSAGLRLGIVCDVGMTGSTVLRSHLSRHGLLSWFDGWSFSDEVGAYKPSPVIFRHALAGLGSPLPGRVAHVGDLRRTDVAGALAMGMVAVRYTGVFDDQTQPSPEGHFVVASHASLPEVLLAPFDR
jgi:FMN phosphatase YigB (HAD superfamily)